MQTVNSSECRFSNGWTAAGMCQYAERCMKSASCFAFFFRQKGNTLSYYISYIYYRYM